MGKVLPILSLQVEGGKKNLRTECYFSSIVKPNTYNSETLKKLGVVGKIEGENFVRRKKRRKYGHNRSCGKYTKNEIDK